MKTKKNKTVLNIFVFLLIQLLFSHAEVYASNKHNYEKSATNQAVLSSTIKISQPLFKTGFYKAQSKLFNGYYYTNLFVNNPGHQNLIEPEISASILDVPGTMLLLAIRQA